MRSSPSGSIACSSPATASGTSSRSPSSRRSRARSSARQLLERARRRRAALERVDEARQRGPVGAPLEPERGDGADADAEVVAARPVGQVVLRAPVVAAEVRGLVPAVARRAEARDHVLVVILQQLGLARQLGAVAVREARAGLRLELVVGEVLGLQRECLVDVAVELGAAHARHAEEQVEREVRHARSPQAADRLAHALGGGAPLEHLELRVRRTTARRATPARRGAASAAASSSSTVSGLTSTVTSGAAGRPSSSAPSRPRAEQRRRAAADEHRLERGREPLALLCQLGQHGRDVALVQRAVARHGHEVAVAAAVRAERDVHVEVADQLGPPPRRVSCAAAARAARASAASRSRPAPSASVSAAMKTSPAP